MPPSGTSQRSTVWPAASAASSKRPPGTLGPWVTESTRTARAYSEQRRCSRWRLDAPGGRDAGLLEQAAEEDRASRREVVAVVVEHGVHLVGLACESSELLDPLLELVLLVHPVEPVGRLLRLDVPRLLVAPVEADICHVPRRLRMPRDDVGRPRHRRVDRDVGEAVPLQECERVRALLRLHPRSVPELDERYERLEPRANPLELRKRLGGLLDPRVVLQEDPTQFPRQLERLDGGAELGERLVARLSLVPRHRLVSL